MQFTISAAALLALVSAAQAQTAGFNPITTPLKGEAVPACADYTVKWDYYSTYAGTVTIQLLQGATPSTLQLGAVLAAGVDNSLGAFTWPVDCALGSDVTYGIKITYDGDATGATFQYSNPFSITAAAAGAASSSAAPTTAPAANVDVAGGPQTVYSTQYMTITSCAATVTNCPAASTVVSSTSYPVEAPASSNGAQGGSAPPAVVTSAALPTTTLAPHYPAGNATGAVPGVGGNVTMTTHTTGGPSAATATSPIVTAGAGRAAAGGFALVAGLVAAVFVL